MELKQLKSLLESNKVPEKLLIFLCEDNHFLATQYIQKIAEIKNVEVNYLEELSSVKAVSLFAPLEGNSLSVYFCDEFKNYDRELLNKRDLIVVTDKIKDADTKQLFIDSIVTLPKLEDWQLKDYAYSLMDGADPEDIDKVVNLCKGDIYRLNNEVQKVSIFPKIQRKYVLKEFLQDGLLNDLSLYNIFTVSNAIQSRDLKTLSNILPERDYMDVEPLGLLTILYNNFRKMIQVWLSSNPTPESTGLKSNQIWAIKNLPRVYSKEQLINIFESLTDMDRKLKTGEISESMLVDYMILKVLAA